MKKKLAEYKGTYYGYPLYWKVDIGKDKEQEKLINNLFSEYISGTYRIKLSFWERLKQFFK